MNKILLAISLLISVVLQAQLTVNNTTQTPAQLVQNVLIGGGVTPTNIKFNGFVPSANVVRDQVGEFITGSTPTNLGLSRGLIIATGNAQFALGPNNCAALSCGSMPSITANGSDPDLALLSGQTIFNSAVLEFDFVATGLELNFDFVFASEEYPDYVNSINDSFGFFLSGPGITGIYSGGIAKNIALVPSTNTQISINTVNNGPNNNGVSPQNAAYYFNNSTIGLNPNTSPNPTVQYDGFTKVIRAYSTLQCGGTYHIKLAIGNVSDDLLDSAVFLKNFRIAPLVLLDNLGLDNNSGVCFGEVETIYSGLIQGTTTFVWTRNGVVIPGETGPNLTVTTDGVYALTQTSSGGCVIASDDIIITYRPEIPVTTPIPINLCTSSPPPYIFNIDQTASIIGGLNLGDYIVTYYDTNANNEPYNGVPTGIIPDANLSSYSISNPSGIVWVRIEEIATGCVTVKSFALNASSPTASISGTTTICSGTSAVITFSGTPNATVSYTVNSGTSQTILLNATGTASLTTPALTADSTYDLVEVTSNGVPNCSQPQIGSAVVTVKPLPTVTISGTTTICSGSTAVITFTGSPNATVTYFVDAGANQTVLLDATGTATVTTPALTVNSTYTLVSVASNGIPNCSQAQVGSATITIKPLPTASISGTTTICSGTTSVITFTGTPNATVTYTIDAGSNQTILLNGTGSATITTPVLTADSTYDLVSVETNGALNCSQAQTGSVTITVKALPTASISGTTTICSGTTAVITFTGTPNATVTYTINAGSNQTIVLNAAGTASLTTPVLTADSTYDLVSVTSNGVPNCSQVQVGSAIVTVKALPTVTISGTTTICSGSTAVITFTGTPNATVTYFVDAGANQTILLDASGNATLTTPALTIASTYTLVSVTSNGVPNCSQAQVGSVTISIKALPTASISGTTAICSGTTAVITFTGTPNATVTYTVNAGSNQTIVLNGTGTATLTTPVLTADSTYDLVSVATNGVPNCSQAQTGSVTVTVKPLPTASISGTTTICSGSTAVITFNGTPNATVTYKVDAGSNQTILLSATGTATLTTPILTADSTYNLVSVTSNGVPNCSQVQIGSAAVTVTALPTVMITGTTPICSGTTATITFTGTPNATVTFTVDSSANQTILLDALGTASLTTPVLTASSTYTLVSVMTSGLPSCSQAQVGSVTITTIALPTATISGTTQLCLNAAQPQITFTGGNGQAPYTFTYNINSGFPQNITTLSGNSISINVPTSTPGPVTYNLISVSSATTPSCDQPQAGTAIVTIVPLPTATISGTTTICSGTTAVITFNGTPNATVTYKVDAGSNQTILLDAAGTATLTTPVLTVNSTYTLISVASNGVTNCSQAQVGSATITIKALPTAAISGTTTICSGTTATITFTGTPNATVTYKVDAGPNQTILLNATGTATLTTPALTVNSTYDLVSVASNGLPNCSQNQVGSVTISIKALPTASISGTTTICSGTTTVITFNGSPNATVTYRVNSGASQTILLNAAGTATLTTPALTADSTYDLVSVTSNGVPNCSQAQVGSVTVTVKALPIATLVGSTICSGTTGTVTFTGTPNATVTYTVNAGSNQTILLNAAGTATITTPVLTANSIYSLVSVTSNGVPNCSQAQVGSATVTVIALPTATISGTAQTCLNSTPPQITFTGVNGQPPYTFQYTINSGLPQTITTTSGNSISINAPTSTSGTYRYDLISVSSNTTPSCSQPQAGSATVKVLALPTATIAGNAQVCINTLPQPQIVFTGSNGVAPYTFNYKINNGPTLSVTTSVGNSVALSASTLVAGTFVYDLVSVSSATTPSCSQPQTGTATVVIKPSSTLTTTSTLIQSVCINTPIVAIVCAIGGSATGATVTGLPAGLTGSLNAAGTIFTISGSATLTGTFPIIITSSGGCSPDAILNGTITVSPNATLVLTSPLPTSNQTLCINTAITPIVYTIGHGATSATASGLPSGVTGVLSGGVYTISGTASSVGTFHYVVTTSGGCSTASLSGVITVNSDVTLLLTSTPITTYQSICLNSAIAPITYAVANGATGANVVGLPSGITGHFSNNIFTITGSTGVTGTFPYVVTTIGGCSSASLNGTIIVNPDATIALSSLPGTNIQRLCINKAITPITYLVGNGATGASLTATSVPLGIIGNYNQTTKTFTISGTATESGTFTYVITTSGGCHAASLTGTITVDPLPVVTLPQDGWICVDENGNPISTFELTTNLSSSQYSFVWSSALGIIPGAIGNSYTATTPGYYSVKVTNIATGCDSSKDATITPSLAPTGVFATASSYFEDDAMVAVTVTPPGNYEYQLDNGLFQEWNEFHNIGSGDHKITVRDKYGCGTKFTYITIMNYPKFFTPNGDGYNDTWNISDLNGQANAKIYIFDRFGKLVKEISPSGTGWDGNFNQNNLPSTDYWFKVFYQENGESKEFKSHFSLKR